MYKKKRKLSPIVGDPLALTKSGHTNLFEVGTMFGAVLSTKALGDECYAFRIWLGDTAEKILARQVEAWYVPIGNNAELRKQCETYLRENSVLAIRGERRTFTKYDKHNRRLTSIQVNLATRICFLGFSEKMYDMKLSLSRLKSADRLQMDTMEDMSDVYEEETAEGADES